MSNIVLLDDEPYTILGMTVEMEDLFPEAKIIEFQDPTAFLQEYKAFDKNSVFVIDYNMKPKNGFDVIMEVVGKQQAVLKTYSCLDCRIQQPIFKLC